jgi:D-alanine-D-alanine ligase
VSADLARAAAVGELVVLHGGTSGEREVSLGSGRAVLEALAGEAALRVHDVEVTEAGAWRVGGRELAPHEALAALPEGALCFLALHGGAGEDGTLQAFLEVCGRRYTGSGVAASALCMDKHLTRLALAAEGLRTARGLLVTPRAWRDARAGTLARAAELLGDGVFAKPRWGGSSVGMRFVEDARALEEALDGLVGAGEQVLLEARVRGVECTCAVLGNRGDELRALPLVEIVPRGAGWFDYREKYDAAGAEELCPPRSIDEATCAQVQALALRAHEAAGCDGYSRTDFIVPADGGAPVALEINTLPGLTPRSLVPQAAAAAGMGFRALCLEIARLAAARWSRS